LRVELEALPLQPGLAEVAERLGLAPAHMAATAGEDYELCACVAPSARESTERALNEAGGEGMSWVGEVIEGDPGVVLIDADGRERALAGFEHRW
jgi:thiamine-monophosphate kinase